MRSTTVVQTHCQLVCCTDCLRSRRGEGVSGFPGRMVRVGAAVRERPVRFWWSRSPGRSWQRASGYACFAVSAGAWRRLKPFHGAFARGASGAGYGRAFACCSPSARWSGAFSWRSVSAWWSGAFSCRSLGTRSGRGVTRPSAGACDDGAFARCAVSPDHRREHGPTICTITRCALNTGRRRELGHRGADGPPGCPLRQSPRSRRSVDTAADWLFAGQSLSFALLQCLGDAVA
jgi:hypothetical protein